MIGIIGAICGDIIGSPFEFRPNRDIKIKYDFNMADDRMRPTDDSVCTLAVADWLLHTDRTHDALIDKLHYWCNKYDFGFAQLFRQWVRNKNRLPYNSYGNGSAMRVSPVAWVAQSEEECLELAKISAEVTHNHQFGILGAQCIALAIYYNRIGLPKDEIIAKLDKRFGFILTHTYDEYKAVHEFNCINQVSVPACIACWYESDSYEDCVRKAIALSGDTDTEACIAGSICNANPDTQITDETLSLIWEHCSFLTDEMVDLINEFHEKYEVQPEEL